MIKINKTQPAPRYLIYEGTPREEDKCHSETQKACEYFESDRYDPSKKCEYEFNSNVYGNTNWKKQLLEDQHNKCCFCESYILHVSPGDVEHFRPKGGYKQSRSEPMKKPGYYWLAYKWDNLLIACESCNRSKKGNLFPLLNPDKRATKKSDYMEDEKPLLINPWNENPENFVEFNLEVPIGIDSEERGDKTIKLLKLDENEHLATMRRDKLSSIETLIKLIEMSDGYESVTKEFALLVKSLDNSSAYSGMVRSNFKDKITELQVRYPPSSL